MSDETQFGKLESNLNQELGEVPSKIKEDIDNNVGILTKVGVLADLFTRGFFEGLNFLLTNSKDTENVLDDLDSEKIEE